jgi:hypothetical protein
MNFHKGPPDSVPHGLCLKLYKNAQDFHEQEAASILFHVNKDIKPNISHEKQKDRVLL